MPSGSPRLPSKPIPQNHREHAPHTNSQIGPSTLDGKVIGSCLPRHRHQEFLRFLAQIDAETPSELELHLIVDNYATHQHPKVKHWLRRHLRFHLHLTPTSASWLNMVECFFRDLITRRVRAGIFRSVAALEAAIRANQQKL